MNQSAIRLLTRSRSLERGWWTKEGIEHLAAAGGRHSFRLYALIMLELAVRLHVEGGTDSVPNCSLEEIADG
jgi:asparagine synthase (glutamine-hydrolysing)